MKKFLLYLLAIILGASVVSAQETFRLRHKPEKGKSYSYKTELTFDMQPSSEGLSPSKGKINLTTKYEIPETTNRGIEVKTAYEAYYGETETEFRDKVVNRGEKLVGKKTAYLISETGELLNKQFVDSLILKSYFSYIATNIFYKFPEKDVKIGDNWQAQTTDSVLTNIKTAPIKTTADFKVEGKEVINGAECLKISYKSVSKYEGKSQASGNGVPLLATTSGEAKLMGIFYFDYKKGIVISVKNSITAEEAIFINDQLMANMVYTVNAAITLL